jgi:hypothetical protein
MAGSRGYYSLIQYCPDQSRLEVANVGVMLFCPELHFLRTLVAHGNDRVRRIFGFSGRDLARIDAIKQAIVARVEAESQNLPTFEEMQQFVRSRANDIVLTPLRPAKVVRPEEDLKALFAELVGGRQRSSHGEELAWLAEVAKAFDTDTIKNKIRRGLHVQLPLMERTIEIPYAFQNGKLNLIKPQQFSALRKEAISRACALAFEGSQLHKHAEQGMERELIVLSAFEDPSGGVLKTIDELLRDNSVRHIQVTNIRQLTEEIERSAHG